MKRLIVLLVLLAVAACDNRRGTENRTYELNRLELEEAISLITPYIREGGFVSGRNRLITVREKPDRLALIEDLLRKYDGTGEALDVVLRIQIIEANGFTQRDTAIADVEQTLRQTFRYGGYRLLGETLVRTREGGKFRNTGNGFVVSGTVDRVRTEGNEQRVPLAIALDVPGKAGLESTVTATIGKPVVIGQSTAGGAIILAVRPALAGT